MMDPDRSNVIQVDCIILRKAEIRIVQVFLQFSRRLYALGPVQHQKALKTAGKKQIRIQRFRQPVFFPADNHQRDGSAVKAGPADRVRQFLPDGMAGLQAPQRFKILLRKRSGKAVPGAGHICGRRIDDPHRKPGLPVHRSQQLYIGGQSRSQVGPRLQQRRRFPQESHAV